MLWLESPCGDVDIEQTWLSISQLKVLEDQTEDDILDQFISPTTRIDFPQSFSEFHYLFTKDFQESYDPSIISSYVVPFIDEKVEAFTVPFEISPGKSLIINAKLSQDQHDQLVHVLQE